MINTLKINQYRSTQFDLIGQLKAFKNFTLLSQKVKTKQFEHCNSSQNRDILTNINSPNLTKPQTTVSQNLQKTITKKQMLSMENIAIDYIYTEIAI